MTRSTRYARRLATLLAAGALGIALAAIPAEAQKQGPPTVHPGNPKNSDRGNFPPGPPGNAVGLPFAASVSELAAALRAGTLAAPDGRALPAAAQTRLLSVLGGRRPPGMDAALADALVASNPDAADEARALLAELDGLLAEPGGRIAPAVTAFNTFVHACSPAFLAAPPAEFLAIRAALEPLARAATRSVAHAR